MAGSYDADVVVWAEQQAAHLRAGRWDQLDLEHLADERQDVGESERGERASRFAVLLAHWLNCVHQPDRRGSTWERTIRERRERIVRRLGKMPSLEPLPGDADWVADVWGDSVMEAIKETGLDVFPERCPWPLPDMLDADWQPA